MQTEIEIKKLYYNMPYEPINPMFVFVYSRGISSHFTFIRQYAIVDLVYATVHYQLISENVKLCVQHLSIMFSCLIFFVSPSQKFKLSIENKYVLYVYCAYNVQNLHLWQLFDAAPHQSINQIF